MRYVPQPVETTLYRSARVLAVLSGVCLLLLLGLVCANIILRPFGGGIRGTLEMSGFLGAMAVGLCMPAAQLAGSHLRAGIWSRAIPRPLRPLELGLANLLCAALLGLVTYELYGLGEYVYEMDEYIDGFGFSYLPMVAGLGIGVFVHALFFLHAAATSGKENERIGKTDASAAGDSSSKPDKDAPVTLFEANVENR